MPLPPIARNLGATVADDEQISKAAAKKAAKKATKKATKTTKAASRKASQVLAEQAVLLGGSSPEESTAPATKTPAAEPPAEEKRAQKATKKTAKKATKKAAKKAAKKATKKAAKKATKKVAKAAAKAPTEKTVNTRLSATDSETRKLFVLDTNVLLHDPGCLFQFKEHDVFIPMMVLEELDHQKKGLSEVARNARQVSRFLDELANTADSLDQPIALDVNGNRQAQGFLHFQTEALQSELPLKLPVGKADNEILTVVHAMQPLQKTHQVILVSKDINMRLKARALGLIAEDYLSDHVIDDTDLLYDGVLPLPDNFWTRYGNELESWQEAGTTYYRLRGSIAKQMMVNQFAYSEGESPLHVQVRECSGKTAVLATLRDYSKGRNNVWGITARNREQNFAFNLLMNHDCDFVSLLGQAGTGKTLLALAADLTQTLETPRYNEIIITRATVSVGDDIGFLPGTEEEKMAPWMGALEDNLEVLHKGMGRTNPFSAGGSDNTPNATMDLIRSRIQVKSMSFMRGRTFMNKYLIIDEAQNLTPKQMKTLITRAGPGTKIVCLGNIAQIDTPYLTEGSSGLTYVVDRFKGWPHAGHITLKRGERSRLADYASEAL